MPARTPEAVAQRVWELLEAKTPWRQITEETGVTNRVISRISREGGRPKRRRAPRPAPAPAPQEGDGMTEFLPASDEVGGVASARHAVASDGAHNRRETAVASASDPAAGAMASARHDAARVSGDEPTGGVASKASSDARLPSASATRHRGGCAHCGTQWAYDHASEAPAACPACGQPVPYACSACGVAFTIDSGDAMPSTCPRCGEAA